MANNPFSGFIPGMQGIPGMGGMPGGASGDFEGVARQYWSAWGDALRAASGQPAVPPGMQGWQDAVGWWSKLAQGGRPESNDVVERFNAQARNWFGQMHNVAAQVAGQDAGPAQITDAWKKALGAAGENPFPEIFNAMRGQGQQGMDQWMLDAAPYLEAWRREGASWMSLPAFGIGREQQERHQALLRAHVESQQTDSAYNALMLKAGQRAFEVFQGKLEERSEPGRQLASARALFDLWIDSAEEAYAQIALSPEFRSAYAAKVNAQMRLRSGIQREVEQVCGMFGIPTRSEIDASHRKVADLERQLRRLRDAGTVPPAPARAAASSKPTPRPKARKKAKAAPQRSVAKKVSAAKKVVAKRAPAARRPAAKKATRPARAASQVARKTAPLSALSDIATPLAPAGSSTTRKPRSRSDRA